MSDKPITSFQLPEGKTVDVYLVQLPGGRHVVRTADEMIREPPAPSPSTTNGPRV